MGQLPSSEYLCQTLSSYSPVSEKRNCFFLTILYSAVMKLKILHQFKQLGQVHSDNFCQLTNPHSCNRLPIFGIFHEQRGLPPSASSLLFCLITSAHLTSKLLSLGTSPYLPVNLNIQCR